MRLDLLCILRSEKVEMCKNLIENDKKHIFPIDKWKVCEYNEVTGCGLSTKME